MIKQILFVITVFISTISFSQKNITFPSADDLTISSTLYEPKNDNLHMLLLCHQARCSKGEYSETAPKFNELGFTCLAIDQRSGNSINNNINQTAKLAKEKKLPNDYIDAEKDIVASLEYLFKKYNKKIILVGSSYSSSLVIKIAALHQDKVEAVVSFSPGEYFNDSTIITSSLKKMMFPIFITCSKKEIEETSKLLKDGKLKNVTFFKPKQEGKHCSKALWTENPDHLEYWTALLKFISSNNLSK